MLLLLLLLPTFTSPPLALPPGSATVRITHSHTSESMSFTYQRTHKSVCIDTRPDLRPAQCRFSSDEEDEEERDGQVDGGRRPLALTYEQPEAESAGDPAWRVKERDANPFPP